MLGTNRVNEFLYSSGMFEGVCKVKLITFSILGECDNCKGSVSFKNIYFYEDFSKQQTHSQIVE